MSVGLFHLPEGLCSLRTLIPGPSLAPRTPPSTSWGRGSAAWGPPRSGILQCLSFCLRLLSLSTMFSGSPMLCRRPALHPFYGWIIRSCSVGWVDGPHHVHPFIHGGHWAASTLGLHASCFCERGVQDMLGQVLRSAGHVHPQLPLLRALSRAPKHPASVPRSWLVPPPETASPLLSPCGSLEPRSVSPPQSGPPEPLLCHSSNPPFPPSRAFAGAVLGAGMTSDCTPKTQPESEHCPES